MYSKESELMHRTKEDEVKKKALNVLMCIPVVVLVYVAICMDMRINRKLDAIDIQLRYMDEQLSIPITLDCPHTERGEP